MEFNDKSKNYILVATTKYKTYFTLDMKLV